ncbi:MAG: hypothetical protein ACI9JL_003744 [Paracoccaceae bacterium]|jgi:hypothetical protein
MQKYRVQAEWPPYNQYFEYAIKADLFIKHFEPDEDAVCVTDLISNEIISLDTLRNKAMAEAKSFKTVADPN